MEQTAQFIAPSNAASLPSFVPQAYTLQGIAYMGIDNIVMVPEPGALSLLLLGGLPPRRR